VSSLDMVQGDEIMGLITEAGRTVISSLHSIDLSQKFFDRLIGLRGKSIFFDLPASNVTSSMLAELYS